jgi:hypothetical protein
MLLFSNAIKVQNFFGLQNFFTKKFLPSVKIWPTSGSGDGARAALAAPHLEINSREAHSFALCRILIPVWIITHLGNKNRLQGKIEPFPQFYPPASLCFSLFLYVFCIFIVDSHFFCITFAITHRVLKFARVFP